MTAENNAVSLPSVVSEPEVDSSLEPNVVSVEDVLNALSSAKKLPDAMRTRNVRSQFLAAFSLIGGVPRFALWGHQNPDKFYPLYSKLIPAQVTGADGGSIKIELGWMNGRDTTGRSSAIIDVPFQESSP